MVSHYSDRQEREGFRVRAFGGVWKKGARKPSAYKGFEVVLIPWHTSWNCCVYLTILWNLHLKLNAGNICLWKDFAACLPQSLSVLWGEVRGSMFHKKHLRSLWVTRAVVEIKHNSYANTIKLESFLSSFLAHKVSALSYYKSCYCNTPRRSS